MFNLRNITLTHFKNYSVSQFNFSENVVAISGDNGVGKTNLLDAIYYICCTKSYFSTADLSNTAFGELGFRLEALFDVEDTKEQIVCINRQGEKKQVFKNEVLYEKLSDHVGSFPVLMIAPDDITIITGTSEVRRKFIDQLLCQLFPDYIHALMRYNKVLIQRNSALKNFSEQGKIDYTLLDILDEQLTEPADVIYKFRKELMEHFSELVNGFYGKLSGAGEKIDVEYESALCEQNMQVVLQTNRKKDLQWQRTAEGIHRDELNFFLRGNSIKTTASQGQKKSLLFALKLAAYQQIQKFKGVNPILLLDDVFEKLDEKRLTELLCIVCKENQGHVFITDTHADRLGRLLKDLDIRYQSIHLSN